MEPSYSVFWESESRHDINYAHAPFDALSALVADRQHAGFGVYVYGVRLDMRGESDRSVVEWHVRDPDPAVTEAFVRDLRSRLGPDSGTVWFEPFGGNAS